MIRDTLRLLRVNRSYRLLWMAQAVSLCGDWFTLIALAVLVSGGSGGSGLAVGGLALAQLLPMVVVGPWSGVLADRFDRRRLLVASDLARSALVLLLIPAAASGRLSWIYALAFLHFTVSTVFEPTRSALVPRLVETRELVTATTVATVTWSVMAAAGGVVGGTVLSLAGVAGAFVLDALTFLGSAALIAAIPAAAAAARPAGADQVEEGRFRDGLAYVARHRATGAALLVKGINGVAVAEVFLVIYATRRFPLGEGGAQSVGLLWACFGLGAILGPVLLNAANDGSVRRMRRLIVAGSAFLSGSLFALAAAPSLAVAGLAIVLRGMGGAANWTYSTIILQKSVPDRFLGRLFALDLANAFLLAIVFSLLWGAMMDRVGLRPAVFAAATVSLLPLAAWTLGLRWMDRTEA
ncbi:MAG TPA: MFS transporter [Vicinamibacteria bacterium]|nr:MFS transporter [Vicinamibacteria bacterium]